MSRNRGGNMGDRMRPSVKQGEGPARVELGWLLKSLISAGAVAALISVTGVMVGFPSLADDVKDNEKRISAVERALKATTRNQMKIDEVVRQQSADQEWANKKLDALLEASGINRRIPRPKIPDSTLEDVEK